MELFDPLSDRKRIDEFKIRAGPASIPKDPEARQLLLMNMMMNPNLYPPVRRSEKEIAEENDTLRYVQQKKQEKDAAQKAKEQPRESDSDSCTEQIRNQEKKKRAKKQARELKNMRRKLDRPGIPDIPDRSERKPAEASMFIRPIGEDVDLKALKRMNEDEEKHGENPKDGLLTTHPTLSRKEMSKLSGKKLQKEDTKNPVPLQRTYYLGKKKRKTMEPDDEEEFESEVHNVNFEIGDLSSVVNMMKKGVRSWVPFSRTEFLEAMIASMELCTRATEEAYLRTPVEGERRCVADEQCEGMKIDHAKPCILVEMLTKKEREEFERTGGKLPMTRRMCVMCRRYIVGFYYVNIRAECDTMRTNVLLSQYYNLADKCGEYSLDDCIMSSSMDYQGLPGPVPLQVRGKYKQEIQNGVTYFRQVGYKKPEQLMAESARALLFH